MSAQRLFFIFCVFAIAGGHVSGQNNLVVVEGKIVNGESEAPVEFATVSFLDQNDSAFVMGEVTDERGAFSAEIAPGDYIVKVQFISYKTTEKNVRIPAGAKRNIGRIELFEDVEQLSEVIVRGERTQMEVSLDKRIYNIGQDLVNRGGDAAQILGNLPSVSVDVDGNISLRGSQSVKVLIDGKPSSLAGIDGSSALQQMDGNMIDRVEVITNPSARYEAEGMAGIINIVLKKEQRQGVNGTINLEAGHPVDYGAALNLNYRRNWFNIFGSYSLSYRDTPRKGSDFQRFFDEDTSYTTNIEREMRRKGLSNSFRLGGDIYINENNIITASGIYRISDDNGKDDIIYSNRDINNSLVSRIHRFNDEYEDETSLEYNINFTRTFSGHEEHKLTVDMQYQDNKETEDSDIREMEISGEIDLDPLLQQYLNRESEHEYLFQTDYVYPFGENNRFETGWRTTIRRIDNSYIVEEETDGEWVSLPRYTNNFVYNEDIHSAYAIYGREFNRFSLQGGVRAEYTKVETLLKQTENDNQSEYMHVFPSFHATYDLLNEHSVQASYSKRFRRPGFYMLNPFHSYSDSRNIRSGNPNLKPEFTDSYELGYLKNWTDGTFYFGAYYRHTTDEFERVETSVGDTIYSMPINLSVENAYGLEANFSREIFSFLNLDGSFNFYKAISEGEYSNGETSIDLYSETLTMSGRLNLQMKFFEDYNVQVNSFYRAPRNTTQGKQKGMYAVDFGVSKDFFNRKATVVLNARNALNTLRWRSETFGENFYSRSDSRWRPPQFSLSFLYRINTVKNEQSRGRRSGQEPGNQFDNGNGNDNGMDF